ncbi:hypothetical protein EG328_007942 [Venturia inaequalis]|uniref:HAD-superfamily hydrolase n=1 Tax=Venturia inaequalis TaxID=5025 RepID=A0A8H3UD94_VENIN|nr:hypothetical protein EG328_007942 [Venturia inaequalis]RDI89618.1 hypothetical protein Vi05172_g772 [Venturia inaequalis]
MAAPRLFNAPYRLSPNSLLKQLSQSTVRRTIPTCARRRRDYSQPSTPPKPIPDFAFAFDIDGVLLRSHDPIPRAHEALSLLQQEKIPFILLTNGGGKTEAARVEELQERLKIPLDVSMFVQSHTPFADLDQYKDKTILVLGGEEDKCRLVAENYGFKSVVVPGDIFVAHPEIWPFSSQFLPFYKEFARPLPKPIHPTDPSQSLKIDAIFVYNDPRDWGLDATLILDLLLSREGIMGTFSSKNGDTTLPNCGYQSDGQPKLYFSNPDLWWAAKYRLPRLGQGGFRESLEGLWAATTQEADRTNHGQKIPLEKQVIGKPYQYTYAFAEGRLVKHREAMVRGESFPPIVKAGETPPAPSPLKRVYMVGDNPESDIRGGNNYKSPLETEWHSILVETGVHNKGSEPRWKPKQIVGDVYDAVQWALKSSGWKM